MNRANETFRVSEIIFRYILGELTDEEKEQLERWLDEKPDHKYLFEDLVKEAKKSEKVKAYGRIDLYEALEDLLRKKRKMEQMRKKRRFITWATGVAAVILPLAIAFMLHIHRGDSGESMEDVKEVVVLPAGKPRAMLQLASGEEIMLTAGTTQRIKQENGIEIKQDSGVIEYRVDKAKDKEIPQFNIISVPRGGEFSLVLSDGTRVWLDAASRLRYPVTFVGKERRVYLEGEAFFDVAKDKESEFVVETRHADVKVFGTTFDVSAYEDEEKTTATLVRGSIGMEVRETGSEIRLKPGEQACLVGKELTKWEVDTEMYSAWREGRLVFSKVRLEDMLRRLARWYDVDIVFSRSELKDFTFTGEVQKYEDFSEILEVIEMTQIARFQVKGKTIVVY